ncbi:hypothetical protein C8J57DRAFT_1242451 [Mycena rebaudengoi]|nr:hypothetical protein C8J57DRAFT_1242451 [Mycena rebaudengoi]
MAARPGLAGRPGLGKSQAQAPGRLKPAARPGLAWASAGLARPAWGLKPGHGQHYASPTAADASTSTPASPDARFSISEASSPASSLLSTPRSSPPSSDIPALTNDQLKGAGEAEAALRATPLRCDMRRRRCARRKPLLLLGRRGRAPRALPQLQGGGSAARHRARTTSRRRGREALGCGNRGARSLVDLKVVHERVM